MSDWQSIVDSDVRGVVWSDGRPMQIHTTAAGIDVDYCRRDDTYYAHLSGDTGQEYDGYRRVLRPMKLEVLFNLFDIKVQKCRYCKVCDDMLPTNDLCEHVKWLVLIRMDGVENVQ